MAGKRAPRYRAFYESAAYVLTMSAFTREWMQARYPLPEGRYLHCPHPHFQPLLDRYSTNGELVRRLREWAGGTPVIAFLSNMRSEQGPGHAAFQPAVHRLRARRLAPAAGFGGRRQARSGGGRGPIGRAGSSGSVAGAVGTPIRPPTSMPMWKRRVWWWLRTATPRRAAWWPWRRAPACRWWRPRLGGLPEMVRPGVNGESVPPGNPADLARAIAGVVGRLAHYRRGARSCRDVLFSPRQAGEAVADALRAAAPSPLPGGAAPAAPGRAVEGR